jgi:hypothetical protein
VKAILKALIVWITLLALPLEGIASATMCVCAPYAVAHQRAHHDHDHASMAEDAAPAAAAHASPSAHADHHPAQHHHCAKCAACAACGSCMSMAPACLTVLPVPASTSVTVPFDQHALSSVDLALPERPPRA